MTLKKTAVVVAAAMILLLGFAGAALAAGTHMGDGLMPADGTLMSGEGTPGVHEPGTGMTDGMTTGVHEPGTGMTDGMTTGTHEPGTGMTDGMTTGTGMGDGSMHRFADAMGHWYETEAENMASHGFMHGYQNGQFGGEDQITRAQFAAIMARMMDLDSDVAPDFEDMGGHWAAGEVAAMVQAGIIQGHADGTFGPGEPITRAQMAAMMDRAMEHVGLTLTDEEREEMQNRLREHMSDVEGHWAEDHIAHMYELGVTHGDQNGHFRPDEDTNRAQAAAMLWRFYEGQLQ